MLTIMTQRGPPGTRRATFLIAAFFARMGRRVVRTGFSPLPLVYLTAQKT
jgi:hypothetical protein